MTRQQPRLLRDNGDNSVIRVVVAPRSIVIFDDVSTSGPSEYVGRYGARQMLIQGTGVFKFIDASGMLWEFHDFVQTAAPQGQLHRVTPPGGASQIEYAYVDDRLDHMQRTTVDDAETVVHKLAYAYSADLIASVTLTQKIGIAAEKHLRRALYTYDVDQLQQVDQQEYDGTSWNTIGSYHYRYHADGDQLLKLVLGPQAYERAKDDLLNVAAATDEQLKVYADYYYEYDSQGRVNHEEVKGGARVYSFSYELQAKVEGFNKWRTKTIETLPDQSTNTVFANFLGQVLLKERAIGEQKWIEYKVYNDEGRVTERWTPAAVASYSVSDNALSVSATTDGLIQITDYASLTTASESTAGDVKGYPKEEKLRKGSSGLEVSLREVTYYKHVDLNGRDTYPIAEETVHQTEDGLNPSTTSYEYEWYADASNPLQSTSQICQRKTLMPIVSAAQHGAETVDSSVQIFDRNGFETWQRGARGFIRFKKYDESRGVVLQSIEDVDVSLMSDVPSTGSLVWSTPSGWGKHYVTDYAYDVQGRSIQTLGPLHKAVDAEGDEIELRRASWTFYKGDHETWSAQGYQKASDSSVVLMNPVSITRRSVDGMVSDAIVAKYEGTPSLPDPDTDDFNVQADWVRWSRQFSNAQGQLEKSQVYHAIPASGVGSVGANYDETLYAYDELGRQSKVQAPDGTITRTVFDSLGRSVEAWVGTDDVPTTGVWSPTNSAGANLVKVSSTEFDAGGVGNGLVTAQTQCVDANINNDRVTTFEYDWRNRQVKAGASADADGRVTYSTTSYDNANRQIASERYLEQVGVDELLAKGETLYDIRGRVYQRIRYSVENGALGNKMIDRTWYDCCGNAIKQQPAGGAVFTKTQYDSLGRGYKSYTGFDIAGETTYTEAETTVGDSIYEQGEILFDSAGNATATSSLSRYHTFVLSVPSGPLTAGVDSRSNYSARWYDALGRLVTSADYGNQGNDSTAFDRITLVRPVVSSSSVLVSRAEYGDAGALVRSIDHAGRSDVTVHDHAGRVIRTIQNVVGSGDPRTGGADQNITVDTAYAANGKVATLSALQKSSVDDQVTRYVYGTDKGGGTPEIHRNDLLRAEIYPDSDDPSDLLGNGTDGLYDRCEYGYNRQGQVIWKKDQNGTVHSYGYDKLGRQLSDEVTTFGEGIDQTVSKIATAYDKQGLVFQVTSYDALGDEVNQIRRQYNGLGLLVNERQAVTGAVDSGTPGVSYGYDFSASNGEYTKAMRRRIIVYPNGRVMRYIFGVKDSMLNRVSSIYDDNGSGGVGSELVAYQYLGLGAPVVTRLAQPNVELNYDVDGDHAYAGFDRFGRVIEHRWRRDAVGSSSSHWGGDGSSSGESSSSEASPGSSGSVGALDLVHIKHGYDMSGNRLYREDVVAASYGKDFDELYAYDEANRLKSTERGGLDGAKTAILGGSRTFAQEWGLDPLGNWEQFKEDADGAGSWDFTQSREHSKANEIVSISNWTDPQYDRAGNMTAIPRPDDLEDAYRATWDAWGRLAELEEEYSLNAFRTVAEYQYDGLNRRTVKVVCAAGIPTETRRCYFSDAWQLLEERVGSSASAERQFVWGQRYVDDLVLRDRDTSNPINGSLDERLYALQDALFNVIAVMHPSGHVLQRFSYQPYGKIQSMNDEFTIDASPSSYEWEHQFNGRTIDEESGLQVNRMRYLHQQVGEWIARDPIGYAAFTLNLYQSTHGNPIALTDPLGQKATGDVKLYRLAQHFGNSLTNSEMILHWYPPNAWLQSKCECSKVSFYQIASTTKRWTAWDDKSQEPFHYDDIHSGGDVIDWPNSSTSYMDMARLRDTPGFDPMFSVSLAGAFKGLVQRFESCAICVGEGSKRAQEVLGCVIWGHDIKHDSTRRPKQWIKYYNLGNPYLKHDIQYTTTRTSDDVQLQPHSFNDLNKMPGAEPTKKFIQIISARIGKVTW